MRFRPAAISVLCAALFCAPLAATQKPGPAPAPAQKAGNTSPAQVRTAITQLGSFEFPVRMDAGRIVRRAEPSVAVPALLETIGNQKADWYVRFRALVLLSGFNDPRIQQVMQTTLDDRNDRLRALAYNWFEHHPDPKVLPRLVAALDKEETEFVRPAVSRALVAHADDPKVRTLVTGLVMTGQDLFRAVVIEALGERKAGFALQPIMAVAKLEGPLQDDAVLAIGRIGDKRGLV
ncbi:MAG: HEAT repeat domain-containing protein, partial [Vicinamibacterales bacterium]